MANSAVDDPLKKLIRNRPIQEHILSNANHAMIFKAVHRCVEKHKKCKRQIPLLPTRVLEIMPSISPSEKPNIRLYEPSTTEMANYAALSYCWGGPQPFQTTVSNIESYRKGISHDYLPLTVQDAVTTTRALGLKYLWIDSFCIIQDSDDDKAHQLSKMRFIYQDAFITIAATDAKAATDGFLQTSDKPLPRIFKLPCFGYDGTVGTMFLTPCTPVEKQSINQRAWCMVEHLLSWRYLAFDATQRTIQFCCRETATGNGGITYLMGFNRAQTYLQRNLLPKIHRRRGKTASLKLSKNTKFVRIASSRKEGSDSSLVSGSETSSSSSGEAESLDLFWFNLITRYSGRNMTNSEDTLPALSAVAEAFSQFWDGGYMAGLWKHHFPRCLMWRMSTNSTSNSLYAGPTLDVIEPYEKNTNGANHLPSGRRPRNSRGELYFRAPTWSWASVDGVVEFFYPDDDLSDNESDNSSDSDSDDSLLMKYDNHDQRRWIRKITPKFCSWETEPTIPGFEFGAVKSGEIVIEGVLIKPPSDMKWFNPSTRRYESRVSQRYGGRDAKNKEQVPGSDNTGPETEGDEWSDESDDDQSSDEEEEDESSEIGDKKDGSKDGQDSDSSSLLSDSNSESDADLCYSGVGFLDVPGEAPTAREQVACLLLEMPPDGLETLGLILSRHTDYEAWRGVGHFENIEWENFKRKRKVVTIV
ncbi:heterokaryon incompatibility protein-domain-containing protein [Xylariaceae sp. FL0255]|nr:heterokaryon incompatibility protein-domain-containing protein [Xylariaceae sp. FL0255]